MGKDPAFLFYSQDFYTGVATLSWEDRGKYISVLCLMHQQGRMSEETIRFLVGSISVSLKAKFRIDENGLWYSRRLELEAQKRNTFTESRRNNGNLGGRPKKEKPTGKPKRNHKHNHMGNHMGNEDEIVIENKNDNAIRPFDSKKFNTAWNSWLTYRREIKKPYRSAMSEQAALKNLSKHPEETAIAMIENSIANGWQGIFELKTNGNGKSTAKADNIRSINEGIRRRFNAANGTGEGTGSK